MNIAQMRRFGCRGQGMTEYIIIVALIAIAAIATTSFFGSTVRNQVAAMAASLAGNQTSASKATDQATKAGKSSTTEANNAKGLNNFTDNIAATR
ncbi:MAG: pilus assembly protein [Burkholderiales bacterium]|jgi:Tfp pilus assembly protein PilE